MEADTRFPRLQSEIARRRTFAIISHPDAGKTTLTEKLLLYGGAIHLAGAVKARRAARHATSDWMAMERERGISITTSVMQFQYRGHSINLLDTPGHQDFSEDTYRTLAAADSAVMLLDAAKGVEPQTRKLFHVCRMRGIPIFTFVNKMDRQGRDPLDLMAEIEAVLGIRAYPVNWPVWAGGSPTSPFRGVFSRDDRRVHLFESDSRHGTVAVRSRDAGLDDPDLRALLGGSAHRRLAEDVALLDEAGETFDAARVAAGQLTPLFFGSALTNFGVEPFLDRFLVLAPAPGPRATTTGVIEPDDPHFSGFVFKIQANMDPAHRDRVAFLRVCSGRFVGGMTAHHVRTAKDVRLARPQKFFANERSAVEEAWPGDIVGLFDPGIFHIGDTLVEAGGNGEPFAFQGIPRFSPEHFGLVRTRDALRRKQLKKGLEELSEEGTVQVFRQRGLGDKDPIVGAVGLLQFDVLRFRLLHEYGVEIQIEPLPYSHARWVQGKTAIDPRIFERESSTCVEDRHGNLVALFRTDWILRWFLENHPDLCFRDTEP